MNFHAPACSRLRRLRIICNPDLQPPFLPPPRQCLPYFCAALTRPRTPALPSKNNKKKKKKTTKLQRDKSCHSPPPTILQSFLANRRLPRHCQSFNQYWVSPAGSEPWVYCLSCTSLPAPQCLRPVWDDSTASFTVADLYIL